MKISILSVLAVFGLLACGGTSVQRPAPHDPLASAMVIRTAWHQAHPHRGGQATTDPVALRRYNEAVMNCLAVGEAKAAASGKSADEAKATARDECAKSAPPPNLILPKGATPAGDEDESWGLSPMFGGTLELPPNPGMYIGKVGAAAPDGCSTATCIHITGGPVQNSQPFCEFELIVDGRYVFWTDPAANGSVIAVKPGAGMPQLGGELTSVLPRGRQGWIMLSVVDDGQGQILPVEVTKSTHSANIRCWKRDNVAVNPGGLLATAMHATLVAESLGHPFYTGAVQNQEIRADNFVGLYGGELSASSRSLPLWKL